MTTSAVKITQKGQVTIPRKIRDLLKTDTIYFDVVGENVVVRAVRDAAGSLKEFAGNVKPGTSMKEMKESAWEEAVRAKTRK